MTDALLPNGLSDVLPHVAGYEAATMNGLLTFFHQHGYDRVEPPLLEFEESLLRGPGAAMTAHMFRLMDPIGQKMLGVRADITPQVARIASTRLANEARPLRLSYGGVVLRVKGSQLRPERQYIQTGAELIGSDLPSADAEIIILAVTALKHIGIEKIAVDIALPTLIGQVLQATSFEKEAQDSVKEAINRRDIDLIAQQFGETGQLIGKLMQASGRWEEAVQQLKSLVLPANAAQEVVRLETVLQHLTSALPNLMVTIDPLEQRGFEYQTGLSFTVFVRGIRGEIGRGGRYRIAGGQEAAVGFSLYLDSVLRARKLPQTIAKVFVPYGSPPQRLLPLHQDGWVTVSGLSSEENATAEAKRLGCSHILSNDTVIAV